MKKILILFCIFMSSGAFAQSSLDLPISPRAMANTLLASPIPNNIKIRIAELFLTYLTENKRDTKFVTRICLKACIENEYKLDLGAEAGGYIDICQKFALATVGEHNKIVKSQQTESPSEKYQKISNNCYTKDTYSAAFTADLQYYACYLNKDKKPDEFTVGIFDTFSNKLLDSAVYWCSGGEGCSIADNESLKVNSTTYYFRCNCRSGMTTAHFTHNGKSQKEEVCCTLGTSW